MTEKKKTRTREGRKWVENRRREDEREAGLNIREDMGGKN